MREMCCLAVLFFSSALTALAQNYCSLTVRVFTPDRARPEAAVSVQEASGRLVEHDPASADAQFCDLGGLPVTVKVGEDGTCNQVVVRQVPIAWRKPYLLNVMYDPQGCNVGLPRPPVPVCTVIFRVADSQKKWLSEARLKLSEPLVTELRTDNFGRTSVVVKRGDKIAGSVTGAGDSGAFKFSCGRDEQVHEAAIIVSARSDR